MKGVVIFLADGFEDMEALATRDILVRGGIDVRTVSITEDPTVVSSHGVSLWADMTYDEYCDEAGDGPAVREDVMVFPGGMPGSRHLAEHAGLVDRMKRHYAEGGTVAAICAAPGLVLSQLDPLRGVRFTCFEGFQGPMLRRRPRRQLRTAYPLLPEGAGGGGPRPGRAHAMRTGHRFIAAVLLLLAGCNPHQNDTPAAFISFGDMFDKTVGETAGTVTTVAFQAGGPWSARSNAAWLTATPDSGGAGDEVVRVEVTANETGRVRMGSVTFTCGSDKKTLHVTQNAGKVDPGTEPTYGPLLTDGFSQDLHYSTARLRTTSAVMQSFDIASDGMIYYTQLNSNFRVYLSWNERNSQETPTARCMTLCYTAMDNSCTGVGEIQALRAPVAAPRAAWTGETWSGTIGRPGAGKSVWLKTMMTSAMIAGGRVMAVDIEGDMLTILGISSGRIRTYRLSELKALPVRDITLEEITYGGESGSGDAEVTKKPVVKARDASKLKPLGEFAISRSTYADGTTVSWQGFDIHDGLVYQAQGNGHADGTPSPGWLQVRKIDGTTVIPLTKFRALDDLTALKAAGITDTGYMEPEGVKFRDGAVFCGFCSKNSENVRRGTLFRYDPQLVR